MSFFAELKRRNVIRMAILYLVASWVLLQLTDVLSSLLPVPDWAGSLVIMLLALGFAPALIFAWVYEMTPEGLRRERDVDRSQSITSETGGKLNRAIAVLLVIAIAGLAVDRMIPERNAGEASSAVTQEPVPATNAPPRFSCMRTIPAAASRSTPCPREMPATARSSFSRPARRRASTGTMPVSATP